MSYIPNDLDWTLKEDIVYGRTPFREENIELFLGCNQKDIFVFEEHTKIQDVLLFGLIINWRTFMEYLDFTRLHNIHIDLEDVRDLLDYVGIGYCANVIDHFIWIKDFNALRILRCEWCKLVVEYDHTPPIYKMNELEICQLVDLFDIVLIIDKKFYILKSKDNYIPFDR